MKRGKIIKAFFLIFLIAFLAVRADALNISNCASLNKKDTTYFLTGTIIHSSNEDCIKINAENITLDCGENSILSRSKSDVSGIFSDSPRTKVKNCIVKGFKNGKGIYLKNSDNSVITENTIEDNLYGIKGESDNTRIAYNDVDLNKRGIVFSGKNNILSNNRICYNEIEDVNCTSNQTFENNHCDSGKVCGGACFLCSHKDYVLYECKELNKPNFVYTLGSDLNISVPGTCFKISAENITLDCKQKTINYDLDIIHNQDFLISSDKYNTTIRNCIVKGKLLDLRYTGNVINLSGYHSSVINNEFNAVKNALYSEYCFMCNFSSNLFKNIDGTACRIDYAEKSDILNNKVISCENAVSINGGSNINFKNNYIEGSRLDAVRIENKFSQISNNQIMNTGSTSLTINNSEGSYIVGNTIRNAGLYSIYLTGKNNNLLIKDNEIYSSETGIYVREGENIKIIRNNVGGSSFGLKQESEGNSRIEDNIFCGNNKDVYCSSDQNFLNNQCNSERVCGGKCITCGLKNISIWERIKEFFRNLFYFSVFNCPV